MWVTENPQLHPHVVNKLVTHVIFPDGGRGPSTEEMSLKRRAGMQLQLQHSATCALMQEVCEQRVLYTLHDLMLVMRLWMDPPLFIVSAGLHVTYHTCGRQAVLPGPHCSHLWQRHAKDGKRSKEKQGGRCEREPKV